MAQLLNEEVFGKTTLIHADCMDYLKLTPDKYFDLAICDIPYGLPDTAYKSGGGKFLNRILYTQLEKMNRWDVVPEQSYFDELFRVSKNCLIFGGNYVSLPPCRGFVVWDKLQPFSNFSACEYIWTTFNCPSKLIRLCNRGFSSIHPTEKPVQLYRYLLTQFAKKGDKILDTHLGSGSICLACHDLDFEITGIELDEDYYQKAKRRVVDYQKQLKLELFPTPHPPKPHPPKPPRRGGCWDGSTS